MRPTRWTEQQIVAIVRALQQAGPVDDHFRQALEVFSDVVLDTGKPEWHIDELASVATGLILASHSVSFRVGLWVVTRALGVQLPSAPKVLVVQAETGDDPPHVPARSPPAGRERGH